LKLKELILWTKKGQKKKDVKHVDKETERVLQEAKIIARWNKKPFYIS